MNCTTNEHARKKARGDDGRKLETKEASKILRLVAEANHVVVQSPVRNSIELRFRHGEQLRSTLLSVGFNIFRIGRPAFQRWIFQFLVCADDEHLDQ